jgi:Zn-dependent M28 family amino/carboxypeptidase
MQTVSVLVLLGIAAALPVSIPKLWTPRERSVAAEITGAGISARVRYLADDLLEGRGPGSRGSELAMAYVSSEYEKMGLQPLGDSGTFLQRFDIVGMKSNLPSKPVLKGPAGTLTLDPPLDSIVVAGSQTPKAQIADTEVVFCGYGITAPEQKWNDFKDVDVKGKILLVMNNDPESDPALFAGKARLYYGRWTYKFEEAARKGAAGLILIHTTPSAGYPWQVVQTSWTGEDFELPAAGEPRLAVKMWATEDSARKIVALGGRDLDELRKRAESREFQPVPLGVKLSVQVKTELRTFKTANVLGLLPGSDPRLKGEMVVMSAHHDHLGTKPGKGDDHIYNGALDNASGVAAMLTSAQAMVRATPRPRRSILFAAVGVEESGLLGSEYFCAHPPVPPKQIAANFNIDGINIWGRTRDIEYVGLGKSTLDDVVMKVAREQGRTVLPDQFPERGHFYRSDQFNFARVGVPAAYLGKGIDFIGKPAGWGRAQVDDYVKVRYHQPSDQIDASWNLDGAVDDLRLITIAVLRVADAPAAPTWKPGDEFEAARKKE